MSHRRGFSLEMTILDAFGRSDEQTMNFYKAINKKLFFKLVEFYEKYREQIEDRVSRYDEEENGSWRDYSSVVWDDIPDPPEEWFKELDTEKITEAEINEKYE